MSRELFQIIAMKWRSEHRLLLELSDAICELHTKIGLKHAAHRKMAKGKLATVVAFPNNIRS